MNMIISYGGFINYYLYLLCILSMFMFINKNLKETAFNYCAQWSGVDDQKIDCSIISIGVMCHTI